MDDLNEKYSSWLIGRLNPVHPFARLDDLELLHLLGTECLVTNTSFFVELTTMTKLRSSGSFSWTPTGFWGTAYGKEITEMLGGDVSYRMTLVGALIGSRTAEVLGESRQLLH